MGVFAIPRFECDWHIDGAKLNPECFRTKNPPQLAIKLAENLFSQWQSDNNFDVYDCFVDWFSVVEEAIERLDTPIESIEALSIQDTGLETSPLPAPSGRPATPSQVRPRSPFPTSIIAVDLKFSEQKLNNCKSIVESVKNLFKNDPMKKSFLTKAEAVKLNVKNGVNGQIILPSEFICAPSGSGKTTFALNLCSGEIPCVYSLFSYSEHRQDDMQTVYKPFTGISGLFIGVTFKDTKKLGSIDLSLYSQIPATHTEKMNYFLSSWFMLEHANDQDFKYHFVGVLVAVYERLSREKALHPHLTWLELQCMIPSISYKQMTINDGISALNSLRKESDKVPLILVMDECTMAAIAKEHNDHRFKLIRNICRCLSILVVFMGTDARASNMIDMHGHTGLPHDTTYPEWTVGFTSCPTFDKDLLIERCEEVRDLLKDHPSHQHIVDFVQSVAQTEIPWLIDLCLIALKRLAPCLRRNADPFDTLNSMLEYCSQAFMERKSLASGKDDEFSKAFYRGQLLYITNFFWQDLVLSDNGRLSVRRCRQGDEACVNRHLAHLFAFPDKAGESHFAVSAKGTDRVYTRDPSVAYKPSSVFTSFRAAPITGLSMIGMTSKHKIFENRSLLEAWKALDYVPTVIPDYNSGLQLELLFNLCAVIASRKNGPRGCSVNEFLCEFVHQLGCPGVLIKHSVSGPFPWETLKGGGQRRIPFLSPMPMCSWNSALVKLFKNLLPARQMPCLGTYRSAKGSDRCDGVAYYYDPSCTFEEPISDEVIEDVVEKAGVIYPRPLVRPQRGRLVSCKRYPKDIAFVVECKQHEQGLSTASILDIVRSKFTIEEFKKSQLFFIFTTSLKSNALEGLEQELQTSSDLKGVAFWYFDKKVNSNVDYNLTKLPTPQGQVHRGAYKHIILLSLEAIWGAQYSANIKVLSSCVR